jgi:hypothetical protein
MNGAPKAVIQKKSIADDATNKGKKITIYVTNECYPGPQN